MIFRQQPIRQMRTQKTGAAGDDGNRLRSCWHSWCYLTATKKLRARFPCYETDEHPRGPCGPRHSEEKINSATVTARRYRISTCAFYPAFNPAARCTSAIISA